MYKATVALCFKQSFQKLSEENFFRITNRYPTPQMLPDRATIPAKDERLNLHFKFYFGNIE